MTEGFLYCKKYLKNFNFFKVPSRKVLYIKTIEGR